MIEIDHTLLSPTALDNLLIEFITRESTDYGEVQQDMLTKRTHLLAKLEAGEAVLVYFTNEEVCNIVSASDWIKLQKTSND